MPTLPFVSHLIMLHVCSARNCRYRFKDPSWSGNLEISFLPYTFWVRLSLLASLADRVKFLFIETSSSCRGFE